MRRYIAGLFLLFFVAQSSGAAFASTPSDSKGKLADTNIASILQPVLSAIEGSKLVAEFTGNADRYALEHMPMPHLTKRPFTRAASLPDVRTARLATRVLRHGTPEVFVFPKHPPHGRTRDPLAMQ